MGMSRRLRTIRRTMKADRISDKLLTLIKISKVQILCTTALSPVKIKLSSQTLWRCPANRTYSLSFDVSVSFLFPKGAVTSLFSPVPTFCRRSSHQTTIVTHWCLAQCCSTHSICAVPSSSDPFSWLWVYLQYAPQMALPETSPPLYSGSSLAT